MEDIFDSLYVVVAIVIFVSSIVRNRLKKQQQKTVKKPITQSRPVVIPQPNKAGPVIRSAKPTSEFEAVREELAELFGIRSPKPSVPNRQSVQAEIAVPVVKPKKVTVPEKVIVREEEVQPSWQFNRDRSAWQQRIIWTEILGPPKSKRQ
ncbi:hypothetical protein KAH55_14495 [bacterium]|nr:hypothetical protein [bacterium]